MARQFTVGGKVDPDDAYLVPPSKRFPGGVTSKVNQYAGQLMRWDADSDSDEKFGDTLDKIMRAGPDLKRQEDKAEPMKHKPSQLFRTLQQMLDPKK